MTTAQLSELLDTLRAHGVVSFRQGDLAVVFGAGVALPSGVEDRAPQPDQNDPAQAYAQWEKEALHSVEPR